RPRRPRDPAHVRRPALGRRPHPLRGGGRGGPRRRRRLPRRFVPIRRHAPPRPRRSVDMIEPTTLEPVVREVLVAAPAATCYRVFVDGFGTWWPPEHHIGE